MTQHAVIVLQNVETGEILGVYTTSQKAEAALERVPHVIYDCCELRTWFLDRAPETN